MRVKTLVFLLCVVVLAEGLSIHKRSACSTSTNLGKESSDQIIEVSKSAEDNSDECPQWVLIGGQCIDWCDPGYHPDKK
ncbi:hypothetical protein Zmor_008343 [Zophobas morio]|uniref:Uncharacterized protein n=1 Tax=Zophobas morio TaxID=2755281 RepID=A0AA38J272_9CUCU|nr:hypothetical protein Zmor_008343 [Zophobas morio]